MAALAAIQPLKVNTADTGSPQVLTGVIIYLGAMVGIVPASGYARPFATGDFFAGHALETVDNSAGASGAVRVPLLRGDYHLTVPVFNSTAVANIGDPVWGATDNHADLTRSDPGSTMTTTDRKGIVHDIDPSGNVIVRFSSTC